MAIATGIALFKYLKMAPALFLVVVCDSDLTPFLTLCGYDGNEDGSVHYEEAQRVNSAARFSASAGMMGWAWKSMGTKLGCG